MEYINLPRHLIYPPHSLAPVTPSYKHSVEMEGEEERKITLRNGEHPPFQKQNGVK